MINRILALGGISIGMCLIVCSTPQTAVAQQRNEQCRMDGTEDAVGRA